MFKSILKGFRDFLMRGNIVDLAVAVVIGGGFGSIVTALVKDLLTPMVAALGGKNDFSSIYFAINGSKFMIGDFINTLISFLIMAAAIYFVVVTPMNKIMERVNKKKEGEPADKVCPQCLSVVPFKAKRCKYCTVEF